MKKSIIISAIAFILIVASTSFAKDVLVKDALVKNVTIAYTKADKEYARIIIAEERNLNGLNYTVGVPVMVFDTAEIETARNLAPGARLTCIADKGEYKGRVSYTLRAFVD